MGKDCKSSREEIIELVANPNITPAYKSAIQRLKKEKSILMRGKWSKNGRE